MYITAIRSPILFIRPVQHLHRLIMRMSPLANQLLLRLLQREQATFKSMVELISRVIDLDFQEVSAGSGQIRLTTANTWLGGYADYPNTGSYQRLVISDDVTDLGVNGASFMSILWHEFGHTLGLEHPGNYRGGGGSSNAPYLDPTLDTSLLSIMSYNDVNLMYLDVSQASFAPLDLKTLLNIYGPSKNTDGINYIFDNTYTGNSNKHFGQTFVGNDNIINMDDSSVFWAWATNGIDTIDVSNYYRNGVNVHYDIGVYVDTGIGAIYLPHDGSDKTAENGSPHAVEIYDYSNGTIELASENNFSNIRIYQSDHSLAIENVILTDESDSIIIGDLIKNIYAGGGNDVLTGFSDGIILDGGTGNDIWTINDSLSNYISKQTASGFTLANAANESVSYLGIDKVTFTDGNLILDALPSVATTQAYRLYKTAFDREPDFEGLGYWINEMDTGFTLNDVASSFIASVEFKSLYGNTPSNTDFVRLLYNNVLDRDPDEEGYAYWLNDMDNGLSKEGVLISFSESSENQANVIDLIAHGIGYQEWIV
mgnify:FL=1